MLYLPEIIGARQYLLGRFPPIVFEQAFIDGVCLF